MFYFVNLLMKTLYINLAKYKFRILFIYALRQKPSCVVKCRGNWRFYLFIFDK